MTALSTHETETKNDEVKFMPLNPYHYHQDTIVNVSNPEAELEPILEDKASDTN